jgi:hypothetical protein
MEATVGWEHGYAEEDKECMQNLEGKTCIRTWNDNIKMYLRIRGGWN